ncbi:MAG: class IV adenylate cyclase [Promethearchaeota archaeon]
MTNCPEEKLIEVEAKVKIINEAELTWIRSSLLAKKFKELEKHEERDYYFNSPIRDFKQTDEALRLRMIKIKGASDDISLQITWKGPKIDSKLKTREEITITTKNTSISTLRRFLSILGFLEVIKIEKIRESFKKDDIIVSLDNVEKLGLFMEVEVLSTTLEEANSRKKVIKFLHEFIPDFEQRNIRKSYLELLENQLSKNKQ